MDNLLYKNNSNGCFYVIVTKGNSWNVCLEFKNRLNNRLIQNDDLSTFQKIILNENTIIAFLKELGIYDDTIMTIRDYDDYKYIYYKSQMLKIHTWIDIFNFIAKLI